MLAGTLVFTDSMQAPAHLDADSCDWSYPLPVVYRPDRIVSTLGFRNCYRSKTLDISKYTTTSAGHDFCIYLHGSKELVDRSVRLYFWRPLGGSWSSEYTIPLSVVDGREFIELPVTQVSRSPNLGVGGAGVDSLFTHMQIVVMQQCAGISVYANPTSTRKSAIVGPVGGGIIA